MGFWEDHPDLYEQGGVAGNSASQVLLDGNGQVVGAGPMAPPVAGGSFGSVGSGAAALSQMSQPPAFDPYQQVGHDGTINGMNREQYRDAWMSSGVNSVQGAKDWIAKNGGQWVADNGMVRTPFGETLDMGINARGSAAGNGSLRAGWGGGGGGSDAPPVPVGSGQTPAAAAVGGGGFAGGGGYQSSVGQSGHLGGSFKPFEYQNFTAPDAFTAPTADDAQNDAGYQFTLGQGTKALERGAAAKGALRTSGTAKALMDYGQGLASTQYQNVYGRRASEYDRNFSSAFGTNQANNAGNLGAFSANTNADLGYGNLDNARTSTANQYSLGMANVGLGYANNALGYHTADQSYDLGLKNNAVSSRSVDNSYSLGMGNLGLGYGQLGLDTQKNNFYENYSFPINTGYNAAAQQGLYGSQYGNNAAGIYGQQGNAGAAGTMGGANAWQAGITGAGNAGMDAYYANKYGVNPYGAR